jgi:hypothetical protein
VTTEEQVVDVLTKPLSRRMFEHFRDNLGVVPLQEGVTRYICIGG